MAKRDRTLTQRVIERRLKEGRGQGNAAEYQPWLRIQDVAAKGLATRIKGWKTGREHHLMTKLELHFFYVLDWSPFVTDIREHFPLLPLEDTLRIAGEFGIKHPADPRTKQPRVMTTDFLVTVLRGSQFHQVARSIVYAKRLGDRRTIEKLEIEREYWRERGTDWGIVTEQDIPMVIAMNVAIIHNYRDLTDRGNISESNVRNITEVLTTKVLDGVSALRDVAAECDAELGFEPGTSLAVAYHLIATRYWQADLNVPIEPGKPLHLHGILLEEPIRV